MKQTRPQAGHADDDEIDRDDEIEQPRDSRMRIPAMSATSGWRWTRLTVMEALR
jgi:hypothetical protein